MGKTKQNLQKRTLRATAAAVLNLGGAQVIRLATNLIVTRLLFPSAFGLMALVSVVLEAVQMLSDIGIGPNVVRSRWGDEPGFLNTAWTLQVGRGFVMFGAIFLAAPWVARFYGEPQLADLLPVAALAQLVGSFVSTKWHWQERNLNLDRLVVLGLGSQLIGSLVSIAGAFATGSVWALVAGNVVMISVKMLTSHLLVDGTPNRPYWDKRYARELLVFGSWVFLSTTLTFFATRSDRLVFGKLVPMEQLGVYNIGANLAGMVHMALQKLGARVVFPVFSHLRNSGRPLAPMMDRVRTPLLVVAGLGLSGLCALGPQIIDILYDDRYREAGWVVQILAIGNWFRVLEATNGTALLALGKPNWLAAGNGMKLATMAVLIPLGAHFLGFPGAVGGFVGSEMTKYGISLWAVQRSGIPSWRGDARFTLMVLAFGCAPAVLAYILAGIIPSYAIFAMCLATLLIGWLPTAWPHIKELRSRLTSKGEPGSGPPPSD